jgi:BMFP domain-containing protein YqiC
MAAKARSENERLEARIAALEARIGEQESGSDGSSVTKP